MTPHTHNLFTTTCTDGVPLTGKLTLPPGTPRAIVQFNQGTAAKSPFYEPFLEHLAAHGYACALWDYRGSGASTPAAGLRDCDFTYLQYGTHDIPAVRAYLRGRFPDLPFLFVAYPAGGQQLSFGTNFDGVAGALCFGVSSSYTPGLARYYRPRAWVLWNAIGPLILRRHGYLAAARYGLMEDLPAGVFHQWRRWCGSPDYFFADAFYGSEVPEIDWSALPFPVRHVHAVTDEISSPRNVATFWRHWHPGGGVEQVALQPRGLGVRAIRHFDYFRRRFRENIWAEAVRWLDERVD